MFTIRFLLLNFFIIHAAFASDNSTILGLFNLDETNGNKEVVNSNVYASNKTYGMRKNAVIAAFQANSSTPFNYPILGLSNLSSFANYGDRDSVALYSDNSSQPFERWEIIVNTKFNKNLLKGENIDINNIKAGMFLMSQDKIWSAIVIGINYDGIMTGGWINTKTKKIGVPADGTIILVNPITKIWASNFNSFLLEDSRADNSTVLENGVVNNKIPNPNAVNGIDTVILPSSKYGGTAAYLARGSNSSDIKQWLYGFVSQGSKFNFLSSDSKGNQPDVGFKENSSALSGIEFSGKNKNNSIVWKKDDKIIASIDPNGLIKKFGYKTQEVNSDFTISDKYARYIINANNNIKVTLPSVDDVFNGFTIKIMKVTSNKKILFISRDSLINNEKSVVYDGVWNKELVFNNGSWYLY